VEAKIVWIPNEAKIAFFSNFCFIFNPNNFYLNFVIGALIIIIESVVPNRLEKIL
jgi:restriction endonuclease S subunit